MSLQDPDFIMNKIKALTDVADTGEANERVTTRSSNRSKRLKGLVNHEYCDYCDEGGEVIQCEQCPASFHQYCVNPPFENFEEDFICTQCKFNEKLKNHNPNQPGQTDKINFEVTNDEFALSTLIRFAKQINPRQMKLPKSIQTTFQVPGVSKYEWWTKEGNKQYEQKEALKKKDNKDSAIVIPRKTCFICRKTCRIGQLIKCDFCPLLYHLDCLNPPLCNPPKGYFMCPNHIEHFLDNKLLNSSRLSERIKLWNKYSDIDAHRVKLDFISKMNTLKPKHSDQSSLVQQTPLINATIKPTKVPEFIKQSYENPIKVDNIYKGIQQHTVPNGHSHKDQSQSAIKNGGYTSTIRPRALLYHLNSDSKADISTPHSATSSLNYMLYNTFRIGKMDDYDLCLNKCRHTSNKHAVIFYNENMNQYELINYSEYGTVVDNIHYGLDDMELCDGDIRQSSVNDNQKYLQIQQCHTAARCRCDGKNSNENIKHSWEGSALLQHGSHLKFGCLEFVFCIIDYEPSNCNQ